MTLLNNKIMFLMTLLNILKKEEVKLKLTIKIENRNLHFQNQNIKR